MEDITPARRNTQPIRVWVTLDEKAGIEEMARSTGNSTSAFLRKIGLGYEVHSILDYNRAQELVKVNADLGRLGGLLKLWLTNDKRLDGFSQKDLRGLILATLSRIEGNQAQMRELIKLIAFS